MKKKEKKQGHRNITVPERLYKHLLKEKGKRIEKEPGIGLGKIAEEEILGKEEQDGRKN